MNFSKPCTVVGGGEMNRETSSGVSIANSAGASLTSGYHSWADPVSTSTGTRFFGTNTTGTIWQSTASLNGMNDAATPASPAAAIQ